ncbi:DUF317 domain-containing protein [Streptomyces sp. NPDC058603]|uniref:DUF317 domain-containing protein n=1 Tax=Streptomyces sp. NPDC058603 TaxID=3346551 RepID=UPI003655C8B1
MWHSWFDGHTPEDLVTAFVTALADPSPLQRGMYDRTAHHSVVQTPSPLTPEQVAEAHTNRLDTVRAQTRAACRRQRPKPATAPTTTGAAHPAARR